MLKILFEDQHLIVLSKPAGLLSQGEHTGDENLVDLLREHFGRNYVGLIHRLDRNTSGLMVVAKRTKAAQRLTDSLQQGDLKRNYLAWVHGRLKSEKHWSHFLSKNEKTNTVSVIKNPSQGKKSTLTARPLASGTWDTHPLTLVEFILETGRSHQIRVQSAFEGFPLLGDSKYGSSLEIKISFPRTALHSHFLSFPHPMSKETLQWHDALPPDMNQIPQLPLDLSP